MKFTNIILTISLACCIQSLPAQEIRIRAVGDIMLGAQHPDGFLRPDEKGSILKYIRPELQNADLTIGNLEGVLCDFGETTKCEPDSLDCYVFRMEEREVLNLEGAGFDFISLANNHVGDFDLVCAERTAILLDSVGIGWSGFPGTYSSRMMEGVKVGFIAFHSGGHCNSSLDIPAAVSLVEEMDREHDILIVSIHGGAEGLGAMGLPDSMEYYFGEPRGELIKLAHALVDAGVDLVFGHGPHVARAIEIYEDRIIAYSLGNFATYGRFNLQADRRFGGLLEVVLAENGELVRGRIISIEQKYWGVPFLDPTHRFVALVDSLSTQDRPASPLRFHENGEFLLNP